MSENPMRGERELTLLDGRRTIWRCSLDTLVRIERAAGVSVFVLLRDPTKLTLDIAINIIMIGLIEEKLDPFEVAKVKQALWAAGLLAVFATVLKLLETAAGGSEDQRNPLMPGKEETPAT